MELASPGRSALLNDGRELLPTSGEALWALSIDARSHCRFEACKPHSPVLSKTDDTGNQCSIGLDGGAARGLLCL